MHIPSQRCRGRRKTVGKSRLSGRMGNERLITDLPGRVRFGCRAVYKCRVEVCRVGGRGCNGGRCRGSNGQLEYRVVLITLMV